MAARQVSQGRSSFSVKELRYFIGRTTALTGAEGEAFWRKQARQLPEDPEMLVTGEEVASAMLTWLEQLVDEGLGEEDEDTGDDEEEVGFEQVALPPPPSSSPASSRLEARAVSDRPPAIQATTGPPRLSRPVSFQQGLAALLDKGEPWPSQATKETAAEWREIIAFQVSMSRWLAEKKEEVDLTKFHHFAKTYFSKDSRQRSGSSPRRRERRRGRAALALKAVLQNMISKRLAEGFNAWRKSSSVCVERASGIMKELLKSQVQCAVRLESRVRLANRAGGIAFCLAKLQRKALRGAWRQLGNSNPGTSRDGASRLEGAEDVHPASRSGLGAAAAAQHFSAAYPPMAPPRRNPGRGGMRHEWL